MDNQIFMPKKVFVSGCYDLLHSGHVEFFRQASQFGDLYVGIGSDATVLHYKNHKTLYPEQERLFMVKSIKYVKDAFINQGSGVMDFIPTVEALKPDVFVVNADGSNDEKRRFCEERGIEYVVLQRTPAEGLKARSSTDLKAETCRIPTRLDLAGTWIDQPLRVVSRPRLGVDYFVGAHFRGARPLRPVDIYPQGYPEDLANQAAGHGAGDAREVGVLLRERP